MNKRGSYLKVHLYLTVGIMVPPERDLIIPPTVQVTETHLVKPSLCTCSQVSNIDSILQSLVCCSVKHWAYSRAEQLQQLVKTKIMGSERHVRCLCTLRRVYISQLSLSC